ncbi:ankyrin repeat-containing domain protein [Lactarius hengduanensis]|nr:ankyrin repeat-containing domain protein [Lactarius hengduanensis]
MSQAPSTLTSSSNFRSIFTAALKAYEKKTKNDLLAHPLAARLQACNSPGDILVVLQDEVGVFDQSTRGYHGGWTRLSTSSTHSLQHSGKVLMGGISRVWGLMFEAMWMAPHYNGHLRRDTVTLFNAYSTMAHMWIRRMSTKIFRSLWQHKGHDSQTPLLYAMLAHTSSSQGDYPRVVRLLLEHGADANARDTHHRTPLHLVLMSPPNLDVARILLEHGVDVDTVEDEGRTPLQVAPEEGQDEIVRLLSEFRSGSSQS